MERLAFLTNTRLVRYGIGSVVALSSDMGLFMALLIILIFSRYLGGRKVKNDPEAEKIAAGENPETAGT